MCNLYSITTNQAAIMALFRVINHSVGNLPPIPGVFPDFPAPETVTSETRLCCRLLVRLSCRTKSYWKSRAGGIGRSLDTNAQTDIRAIG
jgi:hypothetical protein